MDLIIVGGGIGGLTLALTLNETAIPSRVFDSAPELRSLGVGINLLPHATRELAALGLEAELAKVAVTTREAVFYNRYGQLIFDVPAFIRAADPIIEFPMIDQDPLPWWSAGRVTLLGDAAHPMVPRGSNGAGQAILDARALTECLARNAEAAAALKAYEAMRLAATSAVVLANRTNPPDAILREVFLRTGDRPFERIDDVITHDEIVALSDGYKRVAGYHSEAFERKPAKAPSS